MKHVSLSMRVLSLSSVIAALNSSNDDIFGDCSSQNITSQLFQSIGEYLSNYGSCWNGLNDKTTKDRNKCMYIGTGTFSIAGCEWVSKVTNDRYLEMELLSNNKTYILIDMIRRWLESSCVHVDVADIGVVDATDLLDEKSKRDEIAEKAAMTRALGLLRQGSIDEAKSYLCNCGMPMRASLLSSLTPYSFPGGCSTMLDVGVSAYGLVTEYKPSGLGGIYDDHSKEPDTGGPRMLGICAAEYVLYCIISGYFNIPQSMLRLADQTSREDELWAKCCALQRRMLFNEILNKRNSFDLETPFTKDLLLTEDPVDILGGFISEFVRKDREERLKSFDDASKKRLYGMKLTTEDALDVCGVLCLEGVEKALEVFDSYMRVSEKASIGEVFGEGYIYLISRLGGIYTPSEGVQSMGNKLLTNYASLLCRLCRASSEDVLIDFRAEEQPERFFSDIRRKRERNEDDLNVVRQTLTDMVKLMKVCHRYIKDPIHKLAHMCATLEGAFVSSGYFGEPEYFEKDIVLDIHLEGDTSVRAFNDFALSLGMEGDFISALADVVETEEMNGPLTEQRVHFCLLAPSYFTGDGDIFTRVTRSAAVWLYGVGCYVPALTVVTPFSSSEIDRDDPTADLMMLSGLLTVMSVPLDVSECVKCIRDVSDVVSTNGKKCELVQVIADALVQAVDKVFEYQCNEREQGEEGGGGEAALLVGRVGEGTFVSSAEMLKVYSHESNLLGSLLTQHRLKQLLRIVCKMKTLEQLK